ncbi:hypothetical protein ARTSIC4J27_761 [Pseudarthrobacter siccitolerans]|uniref:Secreted protein n=1 Tax=Pseudarthrobacter siccitolerans TaxID=861266 RepID=A0A024GZB8_9MICC|nr:hypothetical protein ARTSIC4J27_761 [Pseudarthrobacter siccitolerans]
MPGRQLAGRCFLAAACCGFGAAGSVGSDSRSIPGGLSPGVCGGWRSHGAPFAPEGTVFSTPTHGASAFQGPV